MNPNFEALVQDMVRALRFDAPVQVTRPNLPTLEAYAARLAPAWERHWLTNDGCLHAQLEQALTQYLDTPYLRLFCNGTIALLTALQALKVDAGNVITTPFTFPATINVLHWNRLRPVFCDIEPDTYNMNPAGIEALIGPETRAIMPVHVYGRPCNVEAIERIADKHGLPVIYDAAHAFGVQFKGRSLLARGTMSMVSFHATKLFTTAEGGALTMNDGVLYERVRLLKNFGIADEETVVAPGINGKMNELQAALGLVQIERVDAEIQQRQRIACLYHDQLRNTPGLALPPRQLPDVAGNHAYFPVRIDEESYGMDRDVLYTLLKRCNVHARKYFYPLCSTYPWCDAGSAIVPEAEAAAATVLCLPIYGQLPSDAVQRISDMINAFGRAARECR